MGDLSRPAGSAGVSGTGLVAMVVWAYEGPTGTFPVRLRGALFDSQGALIPGVAVAGGTVTVRSPPETSTPLHMSGIASEPGGIGRFNLGLLSQPAPGWG